MTNFIFEKKNLRIITNFVLSTGFIIGFFKEFKSIEIF